MCSEANSLRLAWWNTVEQLPVIGSAPSEAQRWQMELERELPEYQRALGRLRRHLETCPACRRENWGADGQRRADEDVYPVTGSNPSILVRSAVGASPPM